MGGSPDLHAPPPAPSVGVYSSVSSKKKMRINADAAQRSATAIRFVPNVMLLEAAARNDVEEGTWVRLCPADSVFSQLISAFLDELTTLTTQVKYSWLFRAQNVQLSD